MQRSAPGSVPFGRRQGHAHAYRALLACAYLPLIVGRLGREYLWRYVVSPALGFDFRTEHYKAPGAAHQVQPLGFFYLSHITAEEIVDRSCD